MEYGKFILTSVVVAVLAAIISSLLAWGLGALSVFGALSGLATALAIAVIFVWTLNFHKGQESFFEVIPLIIVSISLLEVIRTWIPIIPGLLVTEFTWQNLGLLISAIYLSDAIVKEYIVK